MLLEIQAHLQSFVCSWTVEKYRPCPRAVRNCRDIPLLALWSGGLLWYETIYEDYILKQMEFIEQTEIQDKQISRPDLTYLAGWLEVNQQYSHYMFYVMDLNRYFSISTELQDKLLSFSSQISGANNCHHRKEWKIYYLQSDRCGLKRTDFLLSPWCGMKGKLYLFYRRI